MQKLLYLSYLVFLLGCNSGNNSGANEKQLNKNWNGSWSRVLWQNNGGLTITNVSKDSFAFELNTASGGHDGELDGNAAIKGNKAIYFYKDGTDTCLLEFELFSDSLIVIDEQKGDCLQPMGIVFTGKYYNDKIKHPQQENDEKNQDLLTIGLLKDTVDNNLMRSLVKGDYELFVSSTQLSSEDDDLDSFHAHVYASGVRGLFTEMENIIMINADKNIWAAVIDDEKVYYYTNRKDFVDSLPKTIEKWRENFKQYPVIYKSAK